MASISASIELYDRMSAPLNSIMNAMNLTISSMYDMQDAMGNSMNTSSLDAARDAMTQVQMEIENATNSQEEFNDEVQKSVGTSNQLVDTVKNLAAAYLTVQTMGKVLDVSDELVQTTSRIDMMNDGLQSTDELMSMIYMSAQDARGSFDGMADVVARFGNNAKDAFSSSEEVVQFANIIQKQMTIAGAGTAEAQNAMLQLSQALGSGVLRGDELNSIFEQAPNLIQSIADYLDVPIGTIREMASEGELTADVVKAAIFASADEVNAKFEQMPMTWGQIWQSMQNTALIAFQPVLQRINDIANSDMFQGFVTSATNALAQVSMIILDIFNVIAAVGTFVADNWSIIEPIVMGIVTALGLYYGAMLLYNTVTGVSTAITAAKSFAETVHAASLAMQTGATFAATAAQHGFNAALLACPVTWIIIAIIAVIALIFAICSAIAKMTGVANSGFGVITGGINVAIQFFKNLGLTVANIALGIGNALSAVASNMMTAFHNAICSVQAWFYGLLSDALTVIAGIAEALNKLPFVEFDYSGITSAADDYAAKAAEAEGNKEEYKSISDAFNEGMSTFDTFQDGWASDAFASGAAWGDGVADKVSGMFDGGMGDIDLTGGIDPSFLDSSNFAESAGSGISDTADNTGKLADSVDITNENLKYMRDLAESEAINRFTTAEIRVEMTNNNNVSSGMDIDGMVDTLSAGVLEAMEQAAEGVHD